MNLSERSIKIKELISGKVDMGTFGLIELELIEFEKEITELKKLESNEAKKCLYAFRYCPCIHESGWVTISLHSTYKGAETALNEHKMEELKKWNEMFEFDNEISFKFGDTEDWDITEIEILP